MITYKESSKAYMAIREMVRYHPTLGQHTLLAQSIAIMQKITCGFTVFEVLTILEQAERDEHAK